MAKIEKAPKCPCCGGSVTANATITVRLYPSQVQLLDELVAAAPNDERGNRHNRSTFMRQILNQ
ncbi:hypothetical protein [Trichlorobacter lovleyi]|uniref:hypothetical protein n=1 Tax=Trichlorobacter lovleyi TaxID=313985 RepID=UPI002481530E|nr:hypothetical protein [Trichlorobacter lovleyi]